MKESNKLCTFGMKDMKKGNIHCRFIDFCFLGEFVKRIISCLHVTTRSKSVTHMEVTRYLDAVNMISLRIWC